MISETIKSVPEGFYEVFTYLVPSTFLFGGAALVLTGEGILTVSRHAWPSGDWKDIPLLIVVIFGLFVSGQLLNTVCHYALGKAFWPVWRQRLPTNDTERWPRGIEFEQYQDTLRDAKNRFAEESAASNMPKIAAKKIVSQNMAFAGLCLAVVTIAHCCLVHSDHVNYLAISIVSFVVAILSLLDAWKRLGDEAAYVSSLYRTIKSRAAVPESHS